MFVRVIATYYPTFPTFGARLLRVFVLPLFFAAAAAVLLIGQVRHLLAMSAAVDHEDRVLAAAHATDAAALEMESAALTYVVTSDGARLARYDDARAAAPEAVEQLAELVRGDPSGEARVEAIRAQFAAWEGALSRAIAEKRAPVEASANELRGQVAEIIESARMRSAARTHAAKTHTNIALALGGALVLLLGALVAIAARRQLLGLAQDYRCTIALGQERAESLGRSEARFRRMFESSVIGVVFFQRAGGIREANEAFWEMLGYSDEHPLDLGALGAEMRETNAHPYETSLRDRRGSSVPVLMAVTCLDTAGKECAGFVVDLRARKTLERELEAHLEAERRARAETEEALRLRETFLSIASHELRTPLTALALQVDAMLRTRSQDPDLSLARLRGAEKQVRRLILLVDQLLDVTRITSGKMQFEPETVDAAELVREVVARFGQPDVVVCADEPVLVAADRSRLDQVITNLVGNAVKYGEQAPIHVSVERSGNEARIVVTDHGIGIPRHDQERIFEQFERAVSERRYGGFGLGLWIVRSVLDRMGGTISVSSEAGHGSTFTIVMPIAARARPGAAEEVAKATVV